MGLRRLFGQSGSRQRDPASDFWYAPVNAAGQIVVNADTVSQIPEVFACIQVLAQTIASLPLVTYKRERDGSKTKFDRHPVADLLHHRPNAWQTAFELRGQMTWDLALHRNAFAEIKPGPRGPVDSLERIDPGTIWIVKSGADWVYEVREDGGRSRRLDRDQVFHVRALPLTRDNILGRSLIQDGARTFARAIALQDYAARFFENDATPGGVVEVPGKFGTVEQAHDFKRKWQAEFTGRNRHRAAVLDGGAKYTSIDVQNDKAQFVETYREVALQVIRFWRMPPHKVGILDKATFSNIEQQALEFVVDTLMPWLVAWEQAIRRDLILADGVYFAEHNVGGLLRGDLKSRYDAYAVARNWGWLSVNDIRSLENMNAIPDGDVYLQPLNMAPAGAVAIPAAFDAGVTDAIAAALTQRKLIEVSDALR